MNVQILPAGTDRNLRGSARLDHADRREQDDALTTRG